jgi:hypothetical protein
MSREFGLTRTLRFRWRAFVGELKAVEKAGVFE